MPQTCCLKDQGQQPMLLHHCQCCGTRRQLQQGQQGGALDACVTDAQPVQGVEGVVQPTDLLTQLLSLRGRQGVWMGRVLSSDEPQDGRGGLGTQQRKIVNS